MRYDIRTQRVLRWLPALAYISVIMAMSATSVPLRLPGYYIDKLIHAGVYGLLSALAYMPLKRNGHGNPMVVAFLLALLIGAIDEAIQHFNPARTASIADLAADAVGAYLGGMMARGAANDRPTG